MWLFNKKIGEVIVFIGGNRGTIATKIYSEKDFYLDPSRFFVVYLLKIIWNLDVENKKICFELINSILAEIQNSSSGNLDILTKTDRLNPGVLGVIRYTNEPISFDEADYVFQGKFYKNGKKISVDTEFVKQHNDRAVGHFSLMSAIIFWQSIINFLNESKPQDFKEKSYKYIDDTIKESFAYLDKQKTWSLDVLKEIQKIINK
jgi:hypothetical protein